MRFTLVYIGKDRLNFIAWKVSKYGVFSGPCYPVFGVNTEIYCIMVNELLALANECLKLKKLLFLKKPKEVSHRTFFVVIF